MSEIVIRKVKFEFPDELDDVFPGVDAAHETYLRRAIDRFQQVLLPTQGAKARHRLPTWLRDGKGRYLRTFLPGYNPGELEVDPLVEAVLLPYAAV